MTLLKLSAFRIIQHRLSSLAHHRFMTSTSGTLVQGGTADRSNLISFSSRLRGGRALAQDVWSIYK